MADRSFEEPPNRRCLVTPIATMESVFITFKGERYALGVSFQHTTLADLADAISRKTGVDSRTVKLAVAGHKLIKCSDKPSASLQEAGEAALMSLTNFRHSFGTFQITSHRFETTASLPFAQV